MRYVIMANGKGRRWANYGGISKHAIPVNGETLLQRTVRLAHEADPDAEVFISSSNPANEVEGATRHTPEHGSREIDRFCYELICDDMCFLYGDTYYSERSIRTIEDNPTPDLMFFGSEKTINALRIGDSSVVKGLLATLNRMIDSGQIADAKGWTLYHMFLGMPLDGKKIGDRNFIKLDSATMDINSPADYQQFARTHAGAELPAPSTLQAAAQEGIYNLGIVGKYALRFSAYLLRRKGFSAQNAHHWVKARLWERKFSDRSSSIAERRRAEKKGFLPQAVKRLGIDLDNPGIISQRDYLYVQPFNGVHNKWINDRISALKLFGGYQGYFETCHYHIIRRDNKPFFIPLTDLARSHPSDYQGLYEVLRQRGTMALKESTWNDTDYHTLHASSTGEILLDGVSMTNREFEQWVDASSRVRCLVIFEARRMGPFLGEAAMDGEATLRVVMVNATGTDPKPMQAMIKLGYPLATNTASEFISENDSRERWQNEKDFGELWEDDPLPKSVSAWFRNTRMRWFYASVNVEDGSYDGLRTIDTVDSSKIRESEFAPGAINAFKGTVRFWPEIARTLTDMCRDAPMVKLAEFVLDVSEKDFRIISVHPAAQYNEVIPFEPELNTYLQDCLHAKRTKYTDLKTRADKLLHNLRLTIRKYFGRAVAPKGLVPYQSVRWPGDIMRDLRTKTDVPLAQKLWGYAHGFLSYRLPQYGITPQNWEGFISDFEYRWLRHINPTYRYWVEDKLALQILAPDHADAFPICYFYTQRAGNRGHLVPAAGSPATVPATCEGVFQLVRQKGDLALKPNEGSHGEGFCHLAWTGSEFLMNGQPVTPDDIKPIIEDPDNQYIVTEYVAMHRDMKELYPGSVNTVRIVIYKLDGRTPRIGNSYLRIGTSKTGGVDNVAAGGLVAKVDIATGRYYDAKRLDGVNQGNLVDCPVHPDTGKLIEGILPHWELAKQTVLDIASELPQLEYLGFDVALTEDGVRVIEINRFPDFPRVDVLEPELIDYLLYKLECKKKCFGYDAKPPHKPINLPHRTKPAGQGAAKLRAMKGPVSGTQDRPAKMPHKAPKRAMPAGRAGEFEEEQHA